MKLQIIILASIVLVESEMPEHSMETQLSYANFICPPKTVLRPCKCTTVPDIPTIQCGRIRSLKSVQGALKEWFDYNPIPYLKILDARFEGLPSRAFVSLNVTRLQIKDSNLKWIAVDAFAGMQSLLLLTLHNVALFSFPSESLSHLSSLVSLRLPENKLSELALSHFRGVVKLKYLSLADNKLTNIERRSFPITLVTLSISNNCLRTLNKSLRNLVNLEWLFLNDNRLVNLEGELDGLRSLRQLNLAANAIRRLGRSFRDLVYLQELYLQYNAIHELGTSLQNLSQVRNLNLSMNRLARLNYHSFDRMVSLQSLDLSGNRITFINGAFHALPSLRRLELSHNRLRNLSFSEFSSLTELVTLDVSDNRLNRLQAGHLTITLPTERIFFARNNLTDLNQFLKHFPVLEVVDISDNQMKILKFSDFAMSSSIDYVSVSGNPLICDEEQMSVYHLLKNKNIEVDGQPICDNEPRYL